MLSTPSNKLLVVTDEEFKKVRESYGATAETISKDVDNIIEWFQLQPHLPDVELDRHLVERIYIAQKCSTQRTKVILDLRYMSKIMLPEVFLNRDTRSPLYLETFDNTYYIPLPKLCPDLTRVCVLKLKNEDPESFYLVNLIKFINVVQEIRFMEDYPLGVRLLLDLENVRAGHVLKCNPIIAANSFSTTRKVQGFRFFGMHIINGHKIAENVMGIVKKVMPPKLTERVVMHATLEDLHQLIPKNVLPKDYGGEGDSLEAIAAQWKAHMTSDKTRDYFLEQDKYTSDESRRPKDSLAGEYIGVQGSFKTLNID